jgi:hypothetical protein
MDILSEAGMKKNPHRFYPHSTIIMEIAGIKK